MITFGKYKGLSINEVYAKDVRYINWIMTSFNNTDVKRDIHQYVDSLKDQVVKEFTSKTGKYKLGEYFFKGKGHAKDFISKWLRASYDSYKVQDKDMHWVIDLLKKHPRFSEKSDGFSGVAISFHGNFHFAFVFPDPEAFSGERIGMDISYKKCLNPSIDTSPNQVSKAFRDSIQYQIADYRNKVLANGCICPKTGIQLKNDRETHIDHNYEILPFAKLVDNFCKEYNYNFEGIKVVSQGVTVAFEDPMLTARFQDYHAKHAILRPLHRSANIHEIELVIDIPRRTPRKIDRSEIENFFRVR
jgi:hypothetical protein